MSSPELITTISSRRRRLTNVDVELEPCESISNDERPMNVNLKLELESPEAEAEAGVVAEVGMVGMEPEFER